MAVLLSSSVEDGVSGHVVRVGSDVAEVSVSVWLAWWSDSWVKAGIAVAAARLESIFQLGTSVGRVQSLAHVRWIASVEGSGGDGSLVSGVEVDGNAVSLAGSPSSIGDLGGSDEDSRVAGTWGLIGSDWWDVGNVDSRSDQVAVVEDVAATGIDESVKVEGGVGVVKSEGAAHGSWGTVEGGDDIRSDDGLDGSTVSVAENLSSNVDSSVSGVDSNVALEVLSWHTVVGWVNALVRVTAASGERVVDGGAVVAESHGSAGAGWVTGVDGCVVGVVVDGSSEGHGHALSVAHAVVRLADVLSVEVDSLVADDSRVFAGWDGGNVDSGWSQAVIRVGAAASGDGWVSSWDRGAVSVLSSESESEVAAHTNWGTVVDGSVLSVDNRVKGSAPSITELVSSGVVVVLWDRDSRIATELWLLGSSVRVNAEIVVTAAGVDSSKNSSARVGDSGLLAHGHWVAGVDRGVVGLVGKHGGEAGRGALSLAESVGRVGDWHSVDPDSSVAKHWVLGGRDGGVVNTSEDVRVVDVAVVVSGAAVDLELLVLWWVVGLSLGRLKSESGAHIVRHASEVRDLLSVDVELDTTATALAVHLGSEPRSVVETDSALELLDWVDWGHDSWVNALVLAVAGTSGDKGGWDSVDGGGVEVLALVVKVQLGEHVDWVADEHLSPDVVSVVDGSDTGGSTLSGALRKASSVDGHSVDGDSLVAGLVVLVPWRWGWGWLDWGERAAVLIIAAASLNVRSWDVHALCSGGDGWGDKFVAEGLWHASVHGGFVSLVDSEHTGAHVSWRADDGVSGSEGRCSWSGVVGVESDVAEDVAERSLLVSQSPLPFILFPDAILSKLHYQCKARYQLKSKRASPRFPYFNAELLTNHVLWLL